MAVRMLGQRGMDGIAGDDDSDRELVQLEEGGGASAPSVREAPGVAMTAGTWLQNSLDFLAMLDPEEPGGDAEPAARSDVAALIGSPPKLKTRAPNPAPGGDAETAVMAGAAKPPEDPSPGCCKCQ